MVDAPDPVAPGKILTYRITVALAGARSISSVALETSVPAGTTFESLRGPSSGWAYETPSEGDVGTVSATTATLAPGRPAIFQLSVRVSADLADGATISNAAAVSSSTSDPNPADNDAASSTTVRSAPTPSADLSASVNFLQEPVPSFGQLVEMVVVGNAGPMAATDVVIRTTPPANTTFVSANVTSGSLATPAVGATGTVSAAIDVVPADRVVILTVVWRVTGEPGQRVAVAAAVTASSVDPNPDNNADGQIARIVEAGPLADVSVAIDGVSERVVANADVAYDVVVANAGPTIANDVIVVAPVPANARFVDATVSAGTFRTPPRGRPGAIGWRMDALAPGDHQTLTITVRTGARTGSRIVASALTASRATDLTLANNAESASARVQSIGEAVLAWEPPDVTSGDAPPPTNLVVDTRAASTSAKDAGAPSVARAAGDAPLSYNVYVSSSPNVATTDENLWETVPANQTTTTAPVAPGGSFFTVTAQYATGESGASNVDGDGDAAGATLTSVKLTSSKIVAKGSGFSDTVEVLIDGVPFVDAAKVKSANTKAVQKGSLAIGMTLDEYTAGGTSFLVVVRNDDGGVSAWEVEK
jgi:uncharacterized repeat protein (TIGR01451 family)